MVQSTGPPMSPAVALWFIILGFLSIAVLFVVGFFVLLWTFIAYSCLESTKIVSCAWVRLWDNVSLMLVRFEISSLSSIAAHTIDCSASVVLIWASVSCVWFSDAPYPWGSDVAFLRICYCLEACAKLSLKNCQVFSPTCMSSNCSQAFTIPHLLRISRYAILTTFPPGIGVLAASENSTPSSICLKRSTIGSRSDHSCLIFFSLSSATC